MIRECIEGILGLDLDEDSDDLTEEKYDAARTCYLELYSYDIGSYTYNSAILLNSAELTESEESSETSDYDEALIKEEILALFE